MMATVVSAHGAAPLCRMPLMGAHTLRGRGRAANEDRSVLVPGRGGVLADGIGGEPAGGLMAEACSWEAGRLIREGGIGAAEVLRRAHDAARRTEIALGLAPGPGASCACFMICADGSVEIARAGDVGAFVLDGSGCRRLLDTEEHRDDRGRLAAYLGMPGGAPAIDRARVLRADGARALALASDGVADYVPLSAVRDILEGALDGREPRPADAARALVERARMHGSADDATAVVLAWC